MRTKEIEVQGHKITLTYLTIGQRSANIQVAETEIEKIPKDNIISQEPVPPAKFEEPEPSTIVEPGKEAENAEAWKKHREAKDRFEKAHAEDKPMIAVNLWVPVTVIRKVEMDGHALRIFHTVRGPIMGAVLSEDSTRVWLYSPCFIDPNIERGRVHFLPIAFAGYEFCLYKSGIGESVPQEAETEGYPHFVARNRSGDYTFRLKAAYHHIDADYPEDSRLVSIDGTPRDALMGLLLTSDSREQKLIERARRVQAFHEQQQASAPPAPPATEPVPPSEAPPPAA